MTDLIKRESLQGLLSSIDIRKRFEDMLGKKAPGFISSILSVVSNSSALKECDSMSIIASAAIAASLDLPINQNLGFAAIVPYKGKAQFQMMYKGFVQLAMRSGQYKRMNATEVYEGELKKYDRITGELEYDLDGKTSDTIIGFVSFFKLLNGFEHYFYMTKSEVEAHGKKYSKSYSKENSQWQKGFKGMACKTVLKLNLSKYGVLSIDMAKALEYDQASVTDNGDPEYIDNPEEKNMKPRVLIPELPEGLNEEDIPEFGKDEDTSQ